jgi:hypothetical protein
MGKILSSSLFVCTSSEDINHGFSAVKSVITGSCVLIYSYAHVLGSAVSALKHNSCCDKA